LLANYYLVPDRERNRSEGNYGNLQQLTWSL